MARARTPQPQDPVVRAITTVSRISSKAIEVNELIKLELTGVYPVLGEPHIQYVL